MSGKKELFTDRRWRDPPACEVISRHKLSPEEREEAQKKAEAWLRKKGYLKEGEYIDDPLDITEEQINEVIRKWFPNEGKK